MPWRGRDFYQVSYFVAFMFSKGLRVLKQNTGNYERQKNKTHYPPKKLSADNLFGDLEFS